MKFRENRAEKIPVRENTENVETLPKDRGIMYAQVVNFLIQGEGYCDACC